MEINVASKKYQSQDAVGLEHTIVYRREILHGLLNSPTFSVTQSTLLMKQSTDGSQVAKVTHSWVGQVPIGDCYRGYLARTR